MITQNTVFTHVLTGNPIAVVSLTGNIVNLAIMGNNNRVAMFKRTLTQVQKLIANKQYKIEEA